MAKGSARDICRAFSDLSARAVELQQQCQPMIEREIQSVSLRKSEVVNFLEESCVNFIGEIEENLKLEEKLKQKQNEKEQLMIVQEKEIQRFGRLAELRYKSDPVLVKKIRTKASKKKKKVWCGTAKESQCICGLTILDKELFVVIEKISEVEVYNSMEFCFNRQWNLKELINAMDIASCNRNKCLYIFDFKCDDQSTEILRVDPNGKLIRKWSTGVDGGMGLSVTDESNVILSVWQKHKLNEYSPDGQLLREIDLSLDAGIRYPMHAIKLTNGHFMVSHGFGIRYGGVCTVDADGKLKKSFGGKSGSTFGLMDWPVYLSVDGNGFVMVADQINSRVLLLDSDLKFQREILKEVKYIFRSLWRIHLDESNGRLFVVDNRWNHVKILIFDLK